MKKYISEVKNSWENMYEDPATPFDNEKPDE